MRLIAIGTSGSFQVFVRHIEADFTRPVMPDTTGPAPTIQDRRIPVHTYALTQPHRPRLEDVRDVQDDVRSQPTRRASSETRRQSHSASESITMTS